MKIHTTQNHNNLWAFTLTGNDISKRVEYLESFFMYETESEAYSQALILCDEMEFPVEDEDEPEQESNEPCECHHCCGSGQGCADGLSCSTCGGEGVL